jgi:aldehyde dehydrogenase (NAD+)
LIGEGRGKFRNQGVFITVVLTEVTLQIFGPVLSVGKFKTEEEAISLANDTNYGLGAGLHSSTSQTHT